MSSSLKFENLIYPSYYIFRGIFLIVLIFITLGKIWKVSAVLFRSVLQIFLFEYSFSTHNMRIYVFWLRLCSIWLILRVSRIEKNLFCKINQLLTLLIIETYSSFSELLFKLDCRNIFSKGIFTQLTYLQNCEGAKTNLRIPEKNQMLWIPTLNDAENDLKARTNCLLQVDTV